MAGEDADKVLAALANRINQSLGAARRAFQLDPFTYAINLLPIAASVTGQGEFITTADSAFAIVKTCFTISSNVDGFVANISDIPRFAPLTVTLSDSSSGRDFSNAPISVGNYFGNARDPFIWARPKIVDPSSTIQLKCNNLVATAFNVRFAFHGFKIFGDIAAFKGR